MLKLKQFVLKRVKTQDGDNYFADVVKINDATGMGGFHGYTDINNPALDEYRDLINQNIRLMKSMNASKFILTVDKDVEL